MTDDPKIPLCRSELLQDISIELGRRFAGYHPFRTFSCEVDTCDNDGETLERLTVWASTWYGTLASLALWENGTVCVSVTLVPAENNGQYRLGFCPQCDGFTAANVAEAFRDTVSVSTRLCYGESPLPILRRVWKHRGKVQTSGTLSRNGKSKPGV